jgi:hypothetical protein
MILNLYKNSFIFLLLIFFFYSVTALYAQTPGRSLQETLSILSEDAAREYISPISSAFGADLNGGWFHKTPPAKILGFDLELGFVGMGAYFPQDKKSFSVDGAFRFNATEANKIIDMSGLNLNPIERNLLFGILTTESHDVNISGATVIGSSLDSLRISLPADTYAGLPMPATVVTLPVTGFGDLANINFLPLVAPQFSIGTVFGTQALFRYIPDVQLNEDLGKFQYFGFGIQHNPGVWMSNPLPIDFAGSFFTQTLKIGSLFRTTTTSYGLNISKRLGLSALNITPYAGFMYETANMEVTYEVVAENVPNPGETFREKVNFTIEGENRTRFTIGIGIRLLLFNINADYNFGRYNSFTAGLVFTI